MDLTKRAMLARVSVKGIWNAIAEDEQLTAEVAQRHGLRADLGRYMKKICDPKKVPSLKEFNGARSALYVIHRKMTLAWDDKAGRLLPQTQYFDYMNAISDAKQKVIEKYDAFLNDIPGLKAKFQADPETRGAYRDEDWPDVQQLRDKVNIRVHIQPLADASDFRVQLGTEEEKKIKEQISKDLYAKLAGGLAEMIGDLKECVLDSKQRFESYQLDGHGKTVKTFKDTAVTNIRKMVDNARKLNVMGDSNLDRLLGEIDTLLCQKDPQVLRDNFMERQKTVANATEIAARLASIEAVLGQQAEAA